MVLDFWVNLEFLQKSVYNIDPWREQRANSYTPFSASVTRFGEISPLWLKFTSLGQIFDGLFLIWQNSMATLANL